MRKKTQRYFLLVFILFGCYYPHKIIHTGHNNWGFEYLQTNIPTDWNYLGLGSFRKPQFKIETDTLNYTEGKQSIRLTFDSIPSIMGMIAEFYPETEHERVEISFSTKYVDSKYSFVIYEYNDRSFAWFQDTIIIGKINHWERKT